MATTNKRKRACPVCKAASGKPCTVTVKGKTFKAKKDHAERHATVRGPQLQLAAFSKAKPASGPATGPEPVRTARIRYVETPTKKDGNPFFALRVAPELLDAFKAYARKKGKPATLIVREYMSKVTGVEMSDADLEAA